MFLGQTIHQERLKKQLTQTELAAGICTQNTISKIEKKNLPPTIPILIKICLRLDITLNELFTEFNALDIASDEGVITAEKALLANNSKLAATLIKQVDFTATTDVPYPAIFFFFKGYLSYLNHQSELQIFSAYNSFTASIEDDHSTLKLLLNTGMGLIYQDAGEDLAGFYFNNNTKLIQQLDHPNAIDIQRILFATRHTAEYLIKQRQEKAALQLIDDVLQLSREHQIINQIDYLFYLKAVALKQTNTLYIEPLETARVFSEYLKHNALTAKIEAFK